MVTISRKELYEKVWETPIVRLAQEYGLSDGGLAKICRKHRIPKPPRGYWAKKAVGINMKRLPLPAGENVTITITPNPHSQNVSRRKELAASMQNLEKAPIVVPDRLSSPHPLVKQSSEILSGLQSNEIGIVNPPKEGCLDISVSKESVRRALRIMDTIIKTLEKHGFNVYLSKGHTRTKIKEVPISFRISEKLATRSKRPEEHNLSGRYEFGHSRFVEERAPSGELALTIHEAEGFYIYGCRQNWKDGIKAKLEDRIQSFIDGLVDVAAAKIEKDRERAEEERRRMERQRQLEEERLKRAELRRIYLEEEARVNKLVSDAENWKKSRIIREYIFETKRIAASGELTISFEKPLSEWLSWAHDQADRLDPLTPSPASILDEECPEEEKRNEYPYSRW
ncbi:MAG: hypothetical protein P1P89_13725 [Desulfobacterales bacterium]|nr:hypothetical protein [Desulfobacterales bacterium]